MIRNVGLGFFLCFAIQQAYAQDAAEDFLMQDVHRIKMQHALMNRLDLAYRLELPLLRGQDCTEALDCYLQGRALIDKEPDRQLSLYRRGMAALQDDLKPLPAAVWPENPRAITLVDKESFVIPGELYQDVGIDFVRGIRSHVVEFEVDGLKQYGVMIAPEQAGKYPLLLYVHGAAFGVPRYSLPWLARLAAQGYVVVGPAFRGQPLFTAPVVGVPDYRSDGEIENLLGEVNDALAIVDGAFKRTNVMPGKFGIIGHSFGAGAGLLVAARSDRVACVVSYDAWLTNPLRFYWERLAAELEQDNKEYLWGSWEAYLEHSTEDQVKGLIARSIVHHADKINAPVLLFLGGAYPPAARSAYHHSHYQLRDNLKKFNKTAEFHIIPDGGHNFVLYYNREPALTANRIQQEWLHKYHPPRSPAEVE